jgi:hypothetical protein
MQFNVQSPMHLVKHIGEPIYKYHYMCDWSNIHVKPWIFECEMDSQLLKLIHKFLY